MPRSDSALGSGVTSPRVTVILPVPAAALSGLPSASPKVRFEMVRKLVPPANALKFGVARINVSACKLLRSAIEAADTSNISTVLAPVTLPHTISSARGELI